MWYQNTQEDDAVDVFVETFAALQYEEQSLFEYNRYEYGFGCVNRVCINRWSGEPSEKEITVFEVDLVCVKKFASCHSSFVLILV